MVDYIFGVVSIANIFLTFVAGGIAISLVKSTGKKHPLLRPWRFLIFALILFSFVELISSLRAFNVLQLPFIIHITVSVMVVLLIGALIAQLQVAKEVSK